jgi:hypothetical protein
MAKWTLPENRKPITTIESADLVLRMHKKLAAGFAAGDQAELLEAALQDAQEAEAYAEELEVKLAKAEGLLVDAMVQLENGKIKTRRNRAYLIGQFLAELKGETDE